ncbi:MAG: hypothetical protein COB73_00055 [Flavobacteriaceae bacterium]|nr:MAG: hypothetical protein COB73_00055 [Flavobacteriaceae bacterium]
MQINSANNEKTAAIISYFWWIGLLIAFIMNNNNRSYFTSFHIRQAIGLSIISFFLGLLVQIGFWGIAQVLFLGLFVLWVIGLLSAIKGEAKPIPFVGDLFQDWFKSI